MKSYSLPIFPLPQCVLFPRTHLPLHVFEPRYRAMMEHVMAGEQKLAIAHLREGYQKDYFSAPPVYRVMTAARVLFADKLEDGRWNIMVEGIERIELTEESQTDPFRIGVARPIREKIEESEREEVFRITRELCATAERIGERLGEEGRPLTNLLNTHMHPAIVADVIAARLVTDHYARQSLLEELQLLRRLRLLSVQIGGLVLQLKEHGVSLERPVSGED